MDKILSQFVVCVCVEIAINTCLGAKAIYLQMTEKIYKTLDKEGHSCNDILLAQEKYLTAYRKLREYYQRDLGIAYLDQASEVPKIMPDQLNMLAHDAIMANYNLRSTLLEHGFTNELLQKCYIKQPFSFTSMVSHLDEHGGPLQILKLYGVENLPDAIDTYKAAKIFKDVVVKNLQSDIDISGLNNINGVLKTDSNNIEYVGNEEIETINNDIKDSIEVVDSSTLFDSEIKDIIIKSAIEPDDPFFEMLAIMSIHMIVLYIACNLFVSYWPIVKNYLINYLTGTKLYKRIFKKKRKK